MKEITETEILGITAFKKMPFEGEPGGDYYLILDANGKYLVCGVLRYPNTFVMSEAVNKVLYGSKKDIENHISTNKIELHPDPEAIEAQL